MSVRSPVRAVLLATTLSACSHDGAAPARGYLGDWIADHSGFAIETLPVGRLTLIDESQSESTAAWRDSDRYLTVDLVVLTPFMLADIEHRWEPGRDQIEGCPRPGIESRFREFLAPSIAPIRPAVLACMRGERVPIDGDLADALWVDLRERVLWRLGDPWKSWDQCLELAGQLLDPRVMPEDRADEARVLVRRIERSRSIEAEFYAGTGGWRSGVPMLLRQTCGEIDGAPDYGGGPGNPSPMRLLTPSSATFADLRRLIDLDAATRCFVHRGAEPDAALEMIAPTALVRDALHRLVGRRFPTVAEARAFLDERSTGH